MKAKRNLDPDLAHQYQPYLAKNEIKEVGCVSFYIALKFYFPILDGIRHLEE